MELCEYCVEEVPPAIDETVLMMLLTEEYGVHTCSEGCAQRIRTEREWDTD